jgi:hypothetical protein
MTIPQAITRVLEMLAVQMLRRNPRVWAAFSPKKG